MQTILFPSPEFDRLEKGDALYGIIVSLFAAVVEICNEDGGKICSNQGSCFGQRWNSLSLEKLVNEKLHNLHDV